MVRRAGPPLQELELIRFRRSFEGQFDIGAGRTPDEAVRNLGRRPGLFVLDMYFSEGPEPSADMRREIQRRYATLTQAQTEVLEYLTRHGQSAQGGIDLARRIKKNKKYRGIPYLFFTRKGTLPDARWAFKEGARDVIQKASASTRGRGDFDIQLTLAMQDQASQVGAWFLDAIEEGTWWRRHGAFILGIATTLGLELVAGIAVGVLFRALSVSGM